MKKRIFTDTEIVISATKSKFDVMPDRPFMIRILFAGGGLLAIFSLIFWFTLPVPSPLPPFLVTALLMLGYGAVCKWGSPFPRRKKP